MTARTTRPGLALVAVAGLTAGMLPALAGPAAAVTRTTTTTVADGLNNPRGMAYVEGVGTGPDLLYIAENGTGGDGPCMAGHGEDPNDPDAPQRCYGATGSITEVNLDTGEQRRVVTGLPSLAMQGSGGDGAIGPADVSVAPDRTLRIVIGLGAHPDDRQRLGAEGALFGTLIVADTDTTETDDWRVVADVAQYEADNDPVEGRHGPESNPHAVLARLDKTTLVVDAGGNTLLWVDELAPSPGSDPTAPTYEVNLAERFPSDREAEAPAFLGAPPGTTITYESVPTTVSELSDRRLVVGELTGFPFPVGKANLYEVNLDPDDAPEVLVPGHTTIADVVERGDDLFVAEFAHNGLLSPTPQGAVVRDRSDGTQQALLTTELSFPGGVAADRDGLVYVTTGGTKAGAGQVLRFDPSLAGDPAIQSACPPDEMGGPTYGDIAHSVHEEAIACLTWWGVVNGLDSDRFGPDHPISRAQGASLLARVLAETSTPLPAATADHFDDDNGSAHEDNINRLAEAGLVRGTADRRFSPARDVTRAHLAALSVRAHEHVTGEPLPAGPDAFTDDETSVHEGDINKAATMDWIGDYGGGRFGPGDSITRAQSTSVLARMLSDLVDEGRAQRPA